ncbi:MAG: CPBP family intramembrane metalloprotease [Deltaproteobacteria bacterium]|nr:CPBP family intramembrane metalloprotease [Deltaproteobacteria bacterium]
MLRKVSWIFWSGEERRVRALVRLVAQMLLYLAVHIPLALLIGYLAMLAGDLPGDQLSMDALISMAAGRPVYGAVFILAQVLAAVLSVWAATRFLDRRPFRSLGFRLNGRWWLDYAFGLFTGAAVAAGVFLAELAAGWIELVETCWTAEAGASFASLTGVALLAMIAVGFWEEMVGRGYQIRNLAEGLNLPALGARGAIAVACAGTSLLFGFGHAFNPHASLISSLSIVAFGLLFAGAYVLTGQLGISMGMHTGWNFFTGSVFGFAVSGRESHASLIAISQQGPERWTGGAFGPEAGLVSLAACLLAGALVVGWVRLVHGQLRVETSLASLLSDRT